MAVVLVACTVAGCSGTQSDAQLTQACRQAASQSSPEKLTLAVAQSLSGKQVVTCEVDAQKSSFVLRTASAKDTSKAWMSYVTPGEPLPQECRVLTGSSVYVYDGSAFLLARLVECSYGASASPS